MTTIAEAVKAEAVTEDKLYRAADCVNNAKCVPQAGRDALIAQISAVRAKYPKQDGGDDAPAGAYPDTRPSALRGAASKVAAGMKGGK